MFYNAISKIIVPALIASSLIASSGCGDPKKAAEPSGESSSSQGQSSKLGFFVTLSNASKFPHVVRKSTSFSEKCSIPASTTTNEDIECYIDVMEGDLYFHKLELVYGAPGDMCTYIVRNDAWFWNYPIGTGPTQIDMTINEDTGTNTCNATDRSGTVTTCDANIEISSWDPSNAEANCLYDHSVSDPSAPNCCFGSYVNNVSMTSGGTTTVTSDVKQWNGGTYEACFDGGAKHSGAPLSPDGRPVGVRLFNEKGEDIAYEIEPNISSSGGHFSMTANDFMRTGAPARTPAVNNHTHSGYFSATTSNLPYAVAPIDDLDGSSVPSANPTYTYRCLDAGSEVIHRIQVYVREWNTLQGFMAYTDSEGSSFSPDVDGDEGTDCDYDGSFDNNCNDWTDFDDILRSAGGQYDTTTPNASQRNSWFPRTGR